MSLPGQPPRWRAPGVALHAVLLSLALLLLLATSVLAASPDPTPTVLPPGDPRSEGEGPGGIEVPLFIGLGVVAVGLLAAGGTMIVVRLTRDD